VRYRIYIPSRSRLQQQRTLEQFPKEFAEKRITLIVPKHQVYDYAHKYSDVAVHCFDAPRGIGHARQRIMDLALLKGLDRVVMLDDDMFFYHRAAPFKLSLVKNTPKQNVEMIKYMHALMDKGYAHVGIGARPEASHYLCDYRSCTRINNCHMFDVKKFFESGASFTRIKVMEDFDVELTMLRKGYKNCTTLDYVWNQPGSNMPGGCKDYRTPKVQRKASKKLARLHPKFVKVITKEVRGATSWDGMKTRTDVRIQWRKAYSGKPLTKRWAKEYATRRQAYPGGGK
jgi:hypothetical protein